MRLLSIFIVLILGVYPTCSRERITKIGTATSEVRAGAFSDWLTVTVFYNKKAYTLSMKPGSKVDILREYIGVLFQQDPHELKITVSTMDDTNSATRARKISRRKRVLTADELNQTIEDAGASVFTIKKLEEE